MIGQQISNFQINSQLGSGGMGTVYKAKDVRLNRNVAIKMLPPEEPPGTFVLSIGFFAGP